MTNVLWDQRNRRQKPEMTHRKEKNNCQTVEAVQLWLIFNAAVSVFLLIPPTWKTEIRNWLENNQDNSHSQTSYHNAYYLPVR